MNYVSRKLVLNRLTGSDFSYLVNGVVFMCAVFSSAQYTANIARVCVCVSEWERVTAPAQTQQTAQHYLV